MSYKYIKYCDVDFLDAYKANFAKYLNSYKEKDKESILKIFNSKYIKTSNLKFKYKPLKTRVNSDNPERDNIKIIYETFNMLTPAEATQEKFWTAMYNIYYLDHLFDYIDKYKNSNNLDSKIKSSIVFTHSKKRSLIVHNLSRLWWLGYYLYDKDNKDNPYHLLDFYTNSSDIIGKSTIFFSSNIASNKNIRLGILEGIKELTEEKIIENKRKYYTEISKYFNLIGGLIILDFFSREEIKNETKKHLKEFVKNN